jgi:hypothetical protein
VPSDAEARLSWIRWSRAMEPRSSGSEIWIVDEAEAKQY